MQGCSCCHNRTVENTMTCICPTERLSSDPRGEGIVHLLFHELVAFGTDLGVCWMGNGQEKVWKGAIRSWGHNGLAEVLPGRPVLRNIWVCWEADSPSTKPSQILMLWRKTKCHRKRANWLGLSCVICCSFLEASGVLSRQKAVFIPVRCRLAHGCLHTFPCLGCWDVPALQPVQALHTPRGRKGCRYFIL